MFDSNPIISKELIEAAHRRRTYVLRALVPVVAMLLLVPQLIWVLARYGGKDWRAIAQVSRPIFTTCAWLQLLALSLIAFMYAASSIRDEWTHKTMEVLCASPLSRWRILYGKFAIVLAKALALAVALLPVMGVWFHLGRIPREMAAGSIAVIAGSVLFFASVGLFQAAAFRPQEGQVAGWTVVIVPYFLIVALADAFVLVGHPALEAAIPVRALALVLAGARPGGLSTGAFALLSLGIMGGLSVLLLALSPWVFSRAFARHLGQGRKPRPVRGLVRFLAGSRPRMGAAEDPLYWQEKARATRVLRWAVWVVYGITAVFFIAAGLSKGHFGFLDDEGTHVLLAWEGLGTLFLAALLYGCGVFAREKSRRSAHALLLTGRRPVQFLFSKIRAMYWALRYSILAVALACASMLVVTWPLVDDALALALVLEFLLLGPAVAVVVGMLFSMSAKSPVQAFLGLVAGGVLAFITLLILQVIIAVTMGRGPSLSLLGGLFVAGAAVFGCMVGLIRVWTPWRLSVLLAVSFWIFVTGLVAMFAAAFGSSRVSAAVVTATGTGIVLALAAAWFVLGLRIFDACMAGDPSGVRRRRRARPGPNNEGGDEPRLYGGNPL